MWGTEHVHSIARTLARYRYSYQDELELQNGVATALTDNHLAFEREYSLNKQDRPDFFLPQFGLAIEVKIKFSRLQVFRQLSRYAEHEQVHCVLLITSRSCHAVPDQLNSKPILVLNVGRLT